MYIGYIRDRQESNFKCKQDIKDTKKINSIILGVGVIYIFINSSLFKSDVELITTKKYHNRGLIVQTRNGNGNINSTHIINILRGGTSDLPEDRINTSLKELLNLISYKKTKLKQMLIEAINKQINNQLIQLQFKIIQKDGSVKRNNKLQVHDIGQVELIYFYENVDYKSLF